jgi:hypothetical protein
LTSTVAAVLTAAGLQQPLEHDFDSWTLIWRQQSALSSEAVGTILATGPDKPPQHPSEQLTSEGAAPSIVPQLSLNAEASRLSDALPQQPLPQASFVT